VLNGIDAAELLKLERNREQVSADFAHYNSIEITSQKWYKGGREIIQMLRQAADDLSKTHNNTNTADIVGTSASIAGNAIALGALAAMPFTGGMSVSVALTAGSGTALAGSLTSAGAQLSNKILSKQRIQLLKEKLEENHQDYKELRYLLIDINRVMRRLNQVIPLLGQLAKLTPSQWTTLFETAKRLCSSGWDPKNMESLKDLLLDENVVRFFASTFADSSISLGGIATFVIQSREPLRFALNATVNGIGFYRGIGGLTDAAPLSCSARNVQTGFHAVGLTLDIIHMIEICNRTGEPSYVQQLRDLADEMEEQLDEIIQKRTAQQQ